MKIKFNLALVYHGNSTPLIVYPETGEKAIEFDSMKTMLAEKFNIKRDEMIAIQIVATDGCEPVTTPFDIDIAKKVLNGELDGDFMTSGGRTVKLFSVDIEDTYPIVGTVDNKLLHWDNEGVCSTGEEDDALFINYNGGRFKSADYVKYTKISRDRKPEAATAEQPTDEPETKQTTESNVPATEEPAKDDINKTMNADELVKDMFGKTE